jgi:hypothetical protein
MKRILVLLATMLAAVLLVGGVALAAPPEHHGLLTPNFDGVITINDSATPPTTATPYPSQIHVTGDEVVPDNFTEDSRITDVQVTLDFFSHTRPDDVDVLLVGPHGQSTILMSDAGGSFAVGGFFFLWFSNEKQTKLPVVPDESSLQDGDDVSVYKPANYDGSDADTFPDPANPGEALPLGKKVNLSVFNGTNPIGTWKLYVVDDEEGEAGSMFRWTLRISTRG